MLYRVMVGGGGDAIAEIKVHFKLQHFIVFSSQDKRHVIAIDILFVTVVIIYNYTGSEVTNWRQMSHFLRKL